MTICVHLLVRIILYAYKCVYKFNVQHPCICYCNYSRIFNIRIIVYGHVHCTVLRKQHGEQLPMRLNLNKYGCINRFWSEVDDVYEARLRPQGNLFACIYGTHQRERKPHDNIESQTHNNFRSYIAYREL